jgi:phosphohistidine phosphatase SixA
MKALVMVRHGDNSGEMLTQSGVRTIRALGDRLRERIGQQSCEIHSSNALRAQRTAVKLHEATGAKFQAHPFLQSDDDNPPEYRKLVVLLDQSWADVVIVVTHLEWANEFPTYLFDERQWRLPEAVPRLRKGDALWIDCEAHSFAFV